MTEQNYKNHIRLVPGWHYLTTLLLLALLVGSIINFVRFDPHTHFLDTLVLGICIVLCIFFLFIRLFALRAQDRAIRAEESLRHYILSGKPIDKQLRLGQIIALRFAPDEELVELSKKALSEHLSPKQIKQAIQQWKADHHRV